MHHSRTRIQFGLGPNQLSGPVVDATCELCAEADWGTALIGIPRAVRYIAICGQTTWHQGHIEKGEFAIGNRQADLGEVDGVQPGDYAAAGHELADIDLLAANAATVGRFQFRARQVAGRTFESGACFEKTRLGDIESVLRIIDPRLARDGSILQAALPAEFLIGAAKIALCSSHRCTGCFAIDPVVGRIDSRQYVASFEKTAGDHRR